LYITKVLYPPADSEVVPGENVPAAKEVDDPAVHISAEAVVE